jgi:predicted transcriptional regulator YdeE
MNDLVSLTSHHEADRVIVGIAVRTSLSDAAKDIPATWERFFREGVLETLPRDPADACLYAVYTDYQSDFAGPYTMVLGVAVPEDAKVPVGCRRVTVPSGPYATFALEGDPSRIVWSAWQHVNGAWPERARRRYVADFERYPLETAGRAQVSLTISVGLRPGRF